jgi:hypothetical protein
MPKKERGIEKGEREREGNMRNTRILEVWLSLPP